MIGEAKASQNRRTPGDLQRLETIRGQLVAQGANAGNARLAIFSRSGFEPDLTRVASNRPDVILLGLDRLYGLGEVS